MERNIKDSFYDSKLLGSIIRVNRLSQNMSQTALVEGICVPSYLSRIENAEIVPSMAVVNDIFDALGLVYFDDVAFLTESKGLFDDYVHALFEGELGVAIDLYNKIHQDEVKYMSSPIIIDFLLVKYIHLVGTEHRVAIGEVDRLLTSVEQHMNSEQHHTYALYKGVDLRDVARDFVSAEVAFKKAEREQHTGKIHHEMALLYFEWGNMILALDYINKAQRLYGEEGNIMGLIAVYMIKGQIFIYESQFDTGIEYLIKCSKLLRRIKEPTYEAYIYNHLAWAYILKGDLVKGREALSKSTTRSVLLKQISPRLIQPLALGQKPDWYDDLDAIENFLLEQASTGTYHKLEEKYLELRRNDLYRRLRKYKAIDDCRMKKMQF